MKAVRRVRAGVGWGLVAALAAAGCSDPESGRETSHSPSASSSGPAIRADRPTALADQPVRLTVQGAKPRARVTVHSRTSDEKGRPWGAKRTFTAGRDGTVQLGERGMELLSRMGPLAGKVAAKRGSGSSFSFQPPHPAKHRTYTVRLSASSGGKTLARSRLVRRSLPQNARHRRLTVPNDGVDGELFAPGKGAPRRAGALVFSGSGGGTSSRYAAALLAAHGHPALAVCYFRCGRDSKRPDAINMIELGYFTRAAKLLTAEPSADPRKTAVLGNSRGSEVAQLLGQRRPSVFRDVVAYAPSSKVIGPYPSGRAAWADRGRPVPTGDIPLDRVRGRVLAIAGGNDGMWGSAGAARAIAKQGQQKVVYPHAGHFVNWFPYGQPGEDAGANGDIPATSRADQAARAHGWQRVLRLLGR